ncbi:aminotransferase class I/II-fold pyridoxal phosphate-dependent enzyme [Kitasatospora xanthocidica]|uniref:Aminotransferase class I/II-fold pyridoxal phosphate-dependent enzyme n=1 Tax=Kitasatospora xanthocidica TaxID=83382 RepID=A0A373A364_9ACTN|nr:aminotransferase class I/II-fold pyridoxal phosphate-dependent enzyme [Kitasatospora xanthocidica]RGD62204.1 aminotransferase class I/II-fold pyridoxal phosphate-dependent enzyme [Kitasatospora xanthocidica]
MLDLGGPPRPWPPALVRRFGAAHDRALARADCWSTPPAQGDPELLERLAELFGAPPERTVVTGGVRQFAGSWAGRTRTALVERPGFADIGPVLAGASEVRALAWEDLPGAARGGPEPVTVWVTSPYRNPDGRSLDAAGRLALAELAAEGHQVVVNQVYRWFAPPEEPPDGCWGVTSLAKLCGGGSRLGWATLPDPSAALPTLRAAGPATTWQRAWAGFLDRSALTSLVRACVEPTLEARRLFTERLGELLGWEFTGGGMSLLLSWRGATEERVLAELAGLDLVVGPGSAFDAPPGSVRLAFSGVDAREAVRAADRVARLAARTAGALAPAA